MEMMNRSLIAKNNDTSSSSSTSTTSSQNSKSSGSGGDSTSTSSQSLVSHNNRNSRYYFNSSLNKNELKIITVQKQNPINYQTIDSVQYDDDQTTRDKKFPFDKMVNKFLKDEKLRLEFQIKNPHITANQQNNNTTSYGPIKRIELHVKEHWSNNESSDLNSKMKNIFISQPSSSSMEDRAAFETNFGKLVPIRLEDKSQTSVLLDKSFDLNNNNIHNNNNNKPFGGIRLNFGRDNRPNNNSTDQTSSMMIRGQDWSKLPLIKENVFVKKFETKSAPQKFSLYGSDCELENRAFENALNNNDLEGDEEENELMESSTKYYSQLSNSVYGESYGSTSHNAVYDKSNLESNGHHHVSAAAASTPSCTSSTNAQSTASSNFTSNSTRPSSSSRSSASSSSSTVKDRDSENSSTTTE
jgi:hypothetical protein